MLRAGHLLTRYVVALVFGSAVSLVNGRLTAVCSILWLRLYAMHVDLTEQVWSSLSSTDMWRTCRYDEFSKGDVDLVGACNDRLRAVHRHISRKTLFVRNTGPLKNSAKLVHQMVKALKSAKSNDFLIFIVYSTFTQTVHLRR